MTVSKEQSELASRGYVEITDHERLRAGLRVRNRGQQYIEAQEHGTATVLAVMEKVGSSWAQTYRARDIEVVVKRDDGSVGTWANYGTDVAWEQPVPTEGQRLFRWVQPSTTATPHERNAQ